MTYTMVGGRSIRVLLIIMGSFLFGCLFASSTAKKIIGMRLGSAYSCVAAFIDGDVLIYYNFHKDNHLTPSWVAFTDNETLIGDAAKDQAAVNPERTIFDVKRLIGRKFEDEEVQRDMKLLPYKIVNKDGKPYIQIKIKDGETKLFSPEEITAMILSDLKEEAEGHSGHKIRDAVVTVPAYFDGAQRQATMDAGIIAGLNVTILNEPTAAAIGYGVNKMKDGERKNILVFDLGGGTLDVSILTVENGLIEVLATNGDAHLGGVDFDSKIVEFFIKVIKKKCNKDISDECNKDISKDKIAIGKLRREAERAKTILSSQYLAHVKIDNIILGVNISMKLSRSKFEELNDDLFRKTIGPVQKAMDDAGLEKHQIDEILVIGGSTRIPKVRQLLKDYFNGKDLQNTRCPQCVVAYGAAILGRILSGEPKNDIYKNYGFSSCAFQYIKVVEEEEELNVKEKIDGVYNLVKYVKKDIFDPDKWVADEIARLISNGGEVQGDLDIKC